MDAKFNIESVVNFTKSKITELATKELSNTDKKLKLDNAVVSYITTTINAIAPNFVIRWIINKFLIPYIPILTQAVYDLLKAKIEGVTNG